MSAVTYLVAFIAAGEMRFVLECHGNASGAQKSKIVLIGLVAATIALELLLSANSQYNTLWKLSYKSTSVISFILAAASVAAAALHQPRHKVTAADETIISLAAGTLAFYAVQSFTCNVWRPIFDNAIYTMATGIQTGTPRPAGAILLGILMSPLPRACPASRGYRTQGRSRGHQGPHEQLDVLLTLQTTKRANTRSK